MVENGCNVNAENLDGWSLTARLILSKFYTHNNLIGVVRYLINEGARMKAKESDDKWNALLVLSRNYTHGNLIDLLQLLLEKGVEVSAKTLLGNSAI